MKIKRIASDSELKTITIIKGNAERGFTKLAKRQLKRLPKHLRSIYTMATITPNGYN